MAGQTGMLGALSGKAGWVVSVGGGMLGGGLGGAAEQAVLNALTCADGSLLEAGLWGVGSGGVGAGLGHWAYLRQLRQVRNSRGYAGPPEGWRNTIPEDLVPGQYGKKLQDALAGGDYQPPENYLFAGPELKNTAKFNYVIDSEGTIRVSRPGHHPDLVDGQNVYGAGEMFIDQTGKIVGINARSGHYLPEGGNFFPYLENLLQELGIPYEAISQNFPY